MNELTTAMAVAKERASRFELARPSEGGWARDFLIRERMRAEWSLWLAFTTAEKTLEHERTQLVLAHDKALTDSIRAGLQRL